MASSVDGSDTPIAADRTNRSTAGGAGIPGSCGFHNVAGASVSASATLRGPVRRSRYCANDERHDSASCCRSAGVIVICTSFSASANVSAVTGGPDPAPVPNVGGAPAAVEIGGADCCVVGVASLHAVVATRKPSGALIKNWRRVFISTSSL
jgi:hypothetical protein